MAAANTKREDSSSASEKAIEANSHGPVCVICWDEISDPRLLTCLHSFCRACIDRMAVSEHRPDGECIISCPVCRTPCRLPDGLAAALPKDVTRFPVGGSVCGSCQETGGDGRIVSWCSQCKIAFCSDHAMPHLTSIGHAITPLPTSANQAASAKSSGVPSDEHKYETCVEHEKPKDFFCGKCKESICSQCALLGRHVGHQPIELLKEIRRQRKETIIAKIRHMRTHVLPRWESDLRTLKEAGRQLSVRGNEVRQQIHAATERAVEMIEACAKQKLEEVDEIKQSRLKVLNEQRDELHSHVTDMRSAIAFSKQLAACGCTGETVRLVAALDERVTALRDRKVEMKPKKHPRVGFIPVDEDECLRQAKHMLGTVRECKA